MNHALDFDSFQLLRITTAVIMVGDSSSTLQFRDMLNEDGS